MTKTQFHVETVEDFGQRFIDAWKRAEKGEDFVERHHSFESWETMQSVLSAKRIEMLKYLRTHQEKSIKSLAEHIQRDYRRVHEDVQILRGAGLISQEGLRVECDTISTEIAL
ncbi:hypothetical protein [Terasakiella sp. SH-1]|uniref:HVO_A0114 family putative DNA-binding protein n=1 Tax=Terasakiella sp. SH-1 TaxID=2560057 RepID=UPI00107365D7|nr:hypothetical protein [Terasakiella sp. SH-1]